MGIIVYRPDFGGTSSNRVTDAGIGLPLVQPQATDESKWTVVLRTRIVWRMRLSST